MENKGALSIQEFTERFRVGKTKLFAEIKANRIATYRLGRRRYISAHSAEAWQLSLERAEASAKATEGVAG